MFMGDAGIDKEKDIIDKYNLSDIDALKVGHHGSKTSSGKETVGIIICKQDNEYVIKYCSDNRIIAREYELVWGNKSV